MCFPGRGTHISLGICVSQEGEHISLSLCVSQVGEHISLGLCVSQVAGTNITRAMCFPGREPRERDFIRFHQVQNHGRHSPVNKWLHRLLMQYVLT